ncbi:MAG: serine hydrolase domain-containing protein [Oligoflexales bacterium]
MESTSQSFINSAHALSRPHFESGHFTHVHFQCGNLLVPESWARFSLSQSPLSRYDLASITKALVTSPLVFWSLVKSNKKLSCSLKEWIGTTTTKFSEKILNLSVLSLLSHRSGLPDWQCLWAVCLDEQFQTLRPRDRLYYRLNELAKDCSLPGKYVYSDIGFIILGMCLEEKYGQNLDRLFRNLISEMGLPTSTLSFNLDKTQRYQSIPVGYCPVRKRVLVGEVHDENASILNGLMGHAGLFGTTEDIAKFLAAMMNTDWGNWLLKENSLRCSSEDKMLGLCGWHQGRGDSSRDFLKGSTIGHLGFTGTAFWLDPKSHLYGVLLSNRIIHGRISPWITEFRSKSFSLMGKYLGSLL